MSQLLPPVEEREWIIDALARLGRQTGWDPLVCAPLLLPEPRFFPDRWTPDADGVLRLARRLQLYAGLEQLGAAVELYREHRELELDGVLTRSVHHQGAAAWFAGIVDDVCLFGVDVAQVHDALGITAALAHEIAHAFRAHHEIALADPEQIDEEERLTDLTTVYLGAGVLTTNAAARHRSGSAAGSLLGHRWSFQSLGYLAPEAMSFALAVVAVARGLSRSQRRTLVAALEPNQAASFRHSVTWLEREQPHLRNRLGLPEDPQDWPEPWSLDELTGPLDEGPEPDTHDDEDAEHEATPRDLAAELGPWNEGRPVFRLRPGYERVDNVIAALGGLFIALGVGWFWPGLGLPLWALCAWACRAMIRDFGRDRCSDPSCDERLARHVTQCPNCGGTIMGEIRRRNERLDAEERALGEAADDP